MKVGIIGSGGREHALCVSLNKSNLISKIYCIPGNAGTSIIAENIDINLNNFSKIEDFIIKNNVEKYSDILEFLEIIRRNKIENSPSEDFIKLLVENIDKFDDLEWIYSESQRHR